MDTKIYLLMEWNGVEYEGSQDNVVAVMRGPASAAVDELRSEYTKAMNDVRIAEQNVWKAMSKAERKAFRHSSRQLFQDWLAQWKGFEKLEYQEWSI